MALGVLLLLVGAVLAVVGHRAGRLQMRALGAGLAAFGLVTVVLTLALG